MIQKKGKDQLMSELPTMCNQRMVYFPGYILFVTGKITDKVSRISPFTNTGFVKTPRAAL